MPRGKRNTPFQPGHGLLYGLRPVARDPETNAVTSVACRFCEKFGREEKVGAKRRATQRIKHFKQPFRTENYHQHHQGQHKRRWTEYKSLSTESKVAYLAAPEPSPGQDAFTHIENVVNNPTAPAPTPPVPPEPLSAEQQFPRFQPLRSPTEPRPLKFMVERSIVDVIIGEMFFDAAAENMTKERVVAGFASLPDWSADYSVSVKSQKFFEMAVEHVRQGATAKLAASLIAEMNKSSSTTNSAVSLDLCTEADVSTNIRCVFAYNLQGLADLMRSSWAFSLSLERGDYLSTFYISISIRLCVTDDIHTFHLMAFPAPDRYSMDAVYKSLCCMLDVLCPSWRDKLIGVCTDGSDVAYNASHAIADRFRAETSVSLMRTWSGAHQLDLIIRSVYRNVLDDMFYETLCRLIAYLRRQDGLAAEMKSTCPKVAISSWLSIEKALRWVKTHRIRILQYLDEKKPGFGPSMSWWVLAMALYEFTHAVTKTYNKIRGMTTLVSQQTQYLAELVQTLNRISGCKGPIANDELNRVSQWDVITDNKYVVQKSAVRNFLSGLGSFVHVSMTELPAESLEDVIHAIGTMFLSAVVGLSAIVENRGELTGRASGLPPALPQELIKLTRAAFNGDVRGHAQRLATRFSPADIEKMEEEFGEFLEAFHREEVFKSSLQAIDHYKDFGRAWGVLRARFRHLYMYCGGIGSAFPGKYSTSSQLSLRLHESDVPRLSGMTDFALEGTLQCKQYERIRDLLQLVRS